MIPLLLIPASAQESNTIRLIPTDDTFIIVDVSDPDEFKNLQEKPLGNIKNITIWYSWDFEPGKKVISTAFLKFDLKDISPHEIDSAKLLLYAEQTKIVENSPNVAIFSFTDTSWSEKDFVYGGDEVSEKISNKIMITDSGVGFYEWDITQYVIDNAGSKITIAVNFDRTISGNIEMAAFTSKDSPLSNNHPALVIETSSDPKRETLHFNIVNITPTDDAFIAANLSDPDDIEGFQKTTTGNLDFLRSSYSYNSTKNQEQIMTIPHLKFDLGDIESDKVINAILKLTPSVINTPIGVPPQLDLGLVSDNNWNESEITFLNQPGYSMSDLISSIFIYDTWYSWDVTDLVKENAGSSLSVVFGFKYIYNNTEELVTFHSKEAEDPENFPVIEIKYVAEIQPTPSSLQENETDDIFVIIVGILAVVVVGIIIALILQMKNLKQLAAEQVTTTSEKPRTDSQKQEPSQEIKCESCGKTLAEDYKVCPYCGHIV